MRFPTMSGSFLLRTFQVNQNDRSLKNVFKFKIPSLPNPMNAHSHAYTTSIIYCTSIKHLLRVTVAAEKRLMHTFLLIYELQTVFFHVPESYKTKDTFVTY